MQKRVAVLGSGSWGTALAAHLSRNGSNKVVLWGRDLEILKDVEVNRKNAKYFGNESVSEAVAVCSSLGEAIKNASLVVFAVPSHSVGVLCREIAAQVLENSPATFFNTTFINTAKGLCQESNNRLSEIISSHFPAQELAVLSGPSFALEVLKGLPVAVTVAAKDRSIAQRAASYFHHGAFRVYTSTDVVGVELGGAIKNIIALACGVSDGLGLGLNARAALLTRGLGEMRRVMLAQGASEQTVTGLAGLGDLLLTATGDLSRNRSVGLRLGRGEKLSEILSGMTQVAEAVRTTEHALCLAERSRVDVPIITQVGELLLGKVTPQEALKALLNREQKDE